MIFRTLIGPAGPNRWDRAFSWPAAGPSHTPATVKASDRPGVPQAYVILRHPIPRGWPDSPGVARMYWEESGKPGTARSGQRGHRLGVGGGPPAALPGPMPWPGTLRQRRLPASGGPGARSLTRSGTGRGWRLALDSGASGDEPAGQDGTLYLAWEHPARRGARRSPRPVSGRNSCARRSWPGRDEGCRRDRRRRVRRDPAHAGRLSAGCH